MTPHDSPGSPELDRRKNFIYVAVTATIGIVLAAVLLGPRTDVCLGPRDPGEIEEEPDAGPRQHGSQRTATFDSKEKSHTQVSEQSQQSAGTASTSSGSMSSEEHAAHRALVVIALDREAARASSDHAKRVVSMIRNALQGVDYAKEVGWPPRSYFVERVFNSMWFKNSGYGDGWNAALRALVGDAIPEDKTGKVDLLVRSWSLAVWEESQEIDRRHGISATNAAGESLDAAWTERMQVFAEYYDGFLTELEEVLQDQHGPLASTLDAFGLPADE